MVKFSIYFNRRVFVMICFRRLTLEYQCLWPAHRGPVCSFLVFWLQIAIHIFVLFHHDVCDYMHFTHYDVSLMGRGPLSGSNINL